MIRIARALTTFAAATLLLASPALAQSQANPPAAKDPDVSKPRPPAGATPAPKSAGPKLPPDPVDAIIKSGNLETTLGRAKIRDNLYALLATAPDAKTAKKIAGRLEGIWRRSGSPTVDVLMSRAAKALKEKKFPRALKFLDAAVDLAPDYAGGFNRRAYAHYLAGDLRSAVGDLRRTLALDPNHFRALDGLATILRETGQDAAALKTFDRLLEVHPFADGAQKAFDNLTDDVKGRGI